MPRTSAVRRIRHSSCILGLALLWALACSPASRAASPALPDSLQQMLSRLVMVPGKSAPPSPSKRAAAVAQKPAAVSAPESAPEKVRFSRDIRPILSENCFACHGPDPGSRKADMRLDTREGFFADRGDGPMVVSGKPLQSPLYQRVASKDEGEIMPPLDSHKSLKPGEIALIRRWIEEGAPWQPHWSFLQPEKPALPKVKNAKWAKNPIDAFVLARLESTGLQPAPAAERTALARRAAFDLTGLPPAPEALRAFLADKSPGAYEKFVDGLLASPLWGEHRARYWLDAARYADTHGMHFDNYREMWPYRDWVIRAFNTNQPFDRFTVEQLAGDLLPSPTQDQLVATGFHRANITTNEGGTIEEENLALYANDRVSTTGWVWSGLTMNCAGCHDHKFDPIKQKDFYAMSAFFRNTTQSGLDGNVKDGRSSVITVITDVDDLARYTELPARIKAAQQGVEARKKEATPEFERWLGNLSSVDFKVPAQNLALHLPLSEGAGEQVLGVAASVPASFKSGAPIEWKADGKLGPAPVIKAGATFDLGDAGDFEKDQAWSYGAWVKAPGSGMASVLARMDEGNDFRGWDIWAQERNYATHLIHKWPTNVLKVATTDSPLKPNEWQHIFVTYDGSAKPGGVKIYVDGIEAKSRVEGEANTLSESIRTTTPLRIGQRSKGSVFEGGQVQDVRIYSRRLQASEVKALAHNTALQVLAVMPADKRTDAQKQNLRDHFLSNVDQPFQAATRNVANLESEREGIKAKYPITHIQQERADSMPTANILLRGDYSKLGEKVEADVPSALPPLPKGAPRNRLGLAQWIVAPENPLTARVTVNRFWQEVFGVGIVKTSEDFGIMGEAPSHPELLDWLAVDFRASGWDVKRLFKQMVTSSTYRQAAIATPLKRERDRENRLLSRGPRFRMDAEMLRDYALASGGVLSPKMGGPGARPYNPSGMWDVVGLAEGDTRNYVQDKGENLYRRSVYSFWKRMSPPANLDIFNAPSREVSCVRRERTNTPLQALVTMNDPQFVEAARLLAQSALKSNAKASGDDKALDFITWRLLSRTLRAGERVIVKASLRAMLAEYASKPEEAKALIGVGESKADGSVAAPKLAAWTMVASQIMNLDEALNK